VAVLVGIRQKVNYEAQAAIELEMAIDDSPKRGSYAFELVPEHNAWIISTRPLFEAIVRDLASNTPAGMISARFHNGLIDIFVSLANLLRQGRGLDRVCLSGGTFNNLYLAEHLRGRLVEDEFEVFTQREVPCGDGGLSLGQGIIAAHKIAGGMTLRPDLHGVGR
jgi:hydrogenase maturation protein HypF